MFIYFRMVTFPLLTAFICVCILHPKFFNECDRQMIGIFALISTNDSKWITTIDLRLQIYLFVSCSLILSFSLFLPVRKAYPWICASVAFERTSVVLEIEQGQYLLSVLFLCFSNTHNIIISYSIIIYLYYYYSLNNFKIEKKSHNYFFHTSPGRGLH